RLRELGQIALDPLRAGRVAGLGCGPAGRLQQTAGRGVRELRPRREEAYMAPLRDGRGGGVARFQDDRLQSALEQMGGGGQALRTGSDDDDGIHFNLHVLTFFDESSLPHVSTDVNT